MRSAAPVAACFAVVLLQACTARERPPPQPEPEAPPVHGHGEDAPPPPPPVSHSETSQDDTQPVSPPMPKKADASGAARNEAQEDARDALPAAPAAQAGRRESARAAMAPRPSGGGAAVATTAPALKAGRHDDNKEYARFVQFLHEQAKYVALPVDVSERLLVHTVDAHAQSVANCSVQVADLHGKALSSTVTYADGQTQFFPAAMSAPSDQDYAVTARCAGEEHHVQLQRQGRRSVEVRLGAPRQVAKHVPLDVAIVLDTTGSMQSQIDRLKQTLQAIHFQLTQLPTQPDVHFGLVAYRDHGDDYVTQVTAFTGDVQAFQRVLNTLQADGGGDTPEDMQAGLQEALHTLRWRPDAVRVGFVVADAPPHLDYGEAFDYRAAMQESLQRGIKWVGVGVGGLGTDTEVIFRQLAQYTMGEYVFVTDSEGGDTQGSATEASHHVGTNYHAENLDQAIVRIVRRELSYLGDEPRDFDTTIRASGDAGALSLAMADAVRQLSDYSAWPLAAHTPAAVLPVRASDKPTRGAASRLTDELTLAATRHPSFRVLERDLHAIAAELKVQLSDLGDDTQAVPVGKLLGAQLLVVSNVAVHGDEVALFARLVRVETGEILSVAKVALQANLLDKP